MKISMKNGNPGLSMLGAAFVRLTNGTVEALLSAADTVRTATDIVLSVQHQDETGAPLKSLSSLAQAGFVRLTNGTIEALLSVANTPRTVADVVLATQNIGADGNASPSGYNAAAAQYVQGANFGLPSGEETFGDPAAAPPHSDPFTGDVLAAAAQAEALAIAAPAAGKVWQRLQVFVRWDAAPAAPVAGTPDAVVVIYWYDGAIWNVLGHWPIKYLDGTSAVQDMRDFSDYSEMPLPARAVSFAVGVAGYVDGDFFIDLEAVA